MAFDAVRYNLWKAGLRVDKTYVKPSATKGALGRTMFPVIPEDAVAFIPGQISKQQIFSHVSLAFSRNASIASQAPIECARICTRPISGSSESRCRNLLRASRAKDRRSMSSHHNFVKRQGKVRSLTPRCPCPCSKPWTRSRRRFGSRFSRLSGSIFFSRATMPWSLRLPAVHCPRRHSRLRRGGRLARRLHRSRC